MATPGFDLTLSPFCLSVCLFTDTWDSLNLRILSLSLLSLPYSLTAGPFFPFSHAPLLSFFYRGQHSLFFLRATMHLHKFLFFALLTSSASALPQRRPQIRPPQNPEQFNPPPPSGNGRGGGRNRPQNPPPPPPPVDNNPPPQAAPPPPPGNGNGNNNNNNGGGGGGGGGGAVNTAVIPNDFGIVAGSGRDQVQAGACTGANNAPIPCDCPPAPNDPQFLNSLSQALSQGFFPDQSVTTPISLQAFNDASDQSEATNRQRATAMVQVLQSLSGTKGQGCPGVSYPNLVNQQRTGIVA